MNTVPLACNGSGDTNGRKPELCRLVRVFVAGTGDHARCKLARAARCRRLALFPVTRDHEASSFLSRRVGNAELDGSGRSLHPRGSHRYGCRVATRARILGATPAGDRPVGSRRWSSPSSGRPARRSSGSNSMRLNRLSHCVTDPIRSGYPAHRGTRYFMGSGAPARRGDAQFPATTQ